MVAKVWLTQKDHFFYLLIYKNSDNELDGDPKLLMPFPYNDHNKDEMLEEARKHGWDFAKHLKISLEERLENNA